MTRGSTWVAVLGREAAQSQLESQLLLYLKAKESENKESIYRLQHN